MKDLISKSVCIVGMWNFYERAMILTFSSLRHDGARFFRNILLLSWLIQIMNPWVQNCIIFLKTINDRVSNSSFSILSKTWLFTPQNHRKIDVNKPLAALMLLNRIWVGFSLSWYSDLFPPWFTDFCFGAAGIFAFQIINQNTTFFNLYLRWM